MPITKSCSSRTAAFTLNASDKPRLLFKVRETKDNQDLTVIIRHAPYGELPDTDGNLKSTEISQQYLSVHSSEDSKEQINVITMRTRVKDTGKLIPSMTHYTTAIKQHMHYAPMFTSRCSDLSGDRFVFKAENNVEAFSLGEYEVRLFQPIYMILVSNKKTPAIPEDASINCLQIDFRKFRLTLLWSFLSLPSVRYGRSLLLGTLPQDQLEQDELLRQRMALLQAGFRPETCSFHFSSVSLLFKYDLINRMLSTTSDLPSEEAAKCFKSADMAGEFFKVGVRNDLPYQLHMRQVEAKLLEDPAFRDDPLFQAAKGFDI